jgi:hypothetical protein
MSDDFAERTQKKEPGPQPDPMLKAGSANTMWVWLIGVVIAGVIVAILVALSPTPNTASLPNQPNAAVGSSAPPQSTLPASRDTSSAPPSPPVTTGSGGNDTGR